MWFLRLHWLRTTGLGDEAPVSSTWRRVSLQQSRSDGELSGQGNIQSETEAACDKKRTSHGGMVGGGSYAETPQMQFSKS